MNFLERGPGKFRLIELCGRPVIASPIPEYRKHAKCADCGQPAEFEIREIGTPENWAYCGVCEVG